MPIPVRIVSTIISSLRKTVIIGQQEDDYSFSRLINWKLKSRPRGGGMVDRSRCIVGGRDRPVGSRQKRLLSLLLPPLVVNICKISLLCRGGERSARFQGAHTRYESEHPRPIPYQRTRVNPDRVNARLL